LIPPLLFNKLFIPVLILRAVRPAKSLAAIF